MTPVAIILMIIILGGVWGTLAAALTKMIKMGNEPDPDEEEQEPVS